MKKGIRYLLIILCLIVFIYSGYRIYLILADNHEERNEISKLIDLSKIDLVLEKKEDKVDFEALQKQNSDIVAWIYIPDTNINYPIVHGSDNSYYLTHSFEKKENYAGAIFVDYRNQKDYQDENTLIYGHNMWHDTMFTDIEKLKDEDFFRKHPYVYIYTPTKNYQCEIFSIYTTTDNSDSYQISFEDDEAYLAYLEMVSQRSDFKTDVELDVNKHMISLSTCSHELNNQSSNLRYLLHAFLVEME